MIMVSKDGCTLANVTKMVNFTGLVTIGQYSVSGKALWTVGNRVMVCLDCAKGRGKDISPFPAFADARSDHPATRTCKEISNTMYSVKNRCVFSLLTPQQVGKTTAIARSSLSFFLYRTAQERSNQRVPSEVGIVC